MKNKQIRKDCAGFMLRSIIIRFFSDLFAVFAPTLTALLIGGMSDSLLELDTNAILHALPGFILSIVTVVFVVPILQLIENLCLTKDGFAYDAFLVEKLINMPLIEAEGIESAAVIERLEANATEYCFNQLYKWSRPFIIAAFAGILAVIIKIKEYNIIFLMLIFLSTIPSLIKTGLMSKKQAQANRKASEYNEIRRVQEQKMFGSKNFVQGFGLSSFIIGGLHNSFETYVKGNGKTKYTLEAKSSLLDFLFDYGIKAVVIVVGAIMISTGNLTPGQLLAGILMQPYIATCIAYVSDFINSKKSENENEKRISIFYSDADIDDEETEKEFREIHLRNICFSYPNSDLPTLSNINADISSDENIWLEGENGSGKSTVLSIICGLYTPQSGDITDENGNRISGKALRKQIALQEQDGAVFSGTVFDNLFATEDKKPQCERLLSSMGFNKSLDYEVKPYGKNLSPGEKKKIILTRALLKNTPFLAFDEPFNHVDATSENMLISEIKSGRKGIILISHKTPAGDPQEFMDKRLCIKRQ